MKIGTYNLKFLFDEGIRLHSGKEELFTSDFVEKRFEFFARQFASMDADILFLQELGDESALQKVLDKTNIKYKYFIAKPDKYGVGNAVIFKETIDCVCTSEPTNASMPVFDESDADILGPKMWPRREFVKLVTEYINKPLTILGVHIKATFLMYTGGSSFPESPETLTQVDVADANIRSEMFRLSQAKRMREIVDESFVNDKEAYVVVIGDFNSLKSSIIYKIIKGDLPDRYDSLVQAFEPERIDHILVSKSLEKQVSSYKIYSDIVFPNKPDSIGSDHAPITLDLITV